MDDPALETPLLVYQEEDVRNALYAMREGVGRHFSGDVGVHFALKSCYSRHVLDVLKQEGVGVEVMSALEYGLARTRGFSGPDIVVNGLGRSVELFTQAIDDGACIVMDGEGDVRRLASALGGSANNARLGVRVAVDFPRGTDTPYANPGHKLGLRSGSEELSEILDFCQKESRVQLELIHAHFAINARERHIFELGLSALSAEMDAIESAFPGIRFRGVDIGGGVGTYGPHELRSASDLFAEIGRLAADHFPGRDLVLEPGRYLSNGAGYVVATVLDVKRQADHYVVISDATTNVLIPLETARYGLLVPPPSADGAHLLTVADGITSPDNVVVAEVRVATLPQPGDRILLENCGAYTDVLSHFWAFEPFPVSFLRQDGTLVEERGRDAIRSIRRQWIGA